MITDDELRRVQERKRAEFAEADGEAAEAAAPQAETRLCKLCGKPIIVPPIAGPFGRLALPWNVAHAECLEAERKRREEERWQALRRGRESAVAAVRLDLPAALARCGVPVRWLRASFDGCPDLPQRLVETVQGWTRDPQGILYLYGVPGSGKTWLAVAVLRAVMDAGTYSPEQCLYLSERGFLDGLKATFGNAERGEEVPPRLLASNHPRRVPLLLYDDLASERQTDWTRGAIAGLLEARHAEYASTLITGNVPPSDVARVIDGRLASRLAEDRMMLEFPRRDLRAMGAGRAMTTNPAPTADSDGINDTAKNSNA